MPSRPGPRQSSSRWWPSCALWRAGSSLNAWRCTGRVIWRGPWGVPSVPDRGAHTSHPFRLLRDLDGLEPVAHVHFFEELRDVVLDGAHRQAQLVGDLLVGQSLGDVGEDLLFTVAKGRLQLRLAQRQERPALGVRQQTGGQLRRDKGQAAEK